MEADALTLRTAAGSRCTPGRTLSAATWNIHGAVGLDHLHEEASKFVVRGLHEDSGKVEELDLLKDQLVSTRTMVLADERSRALRPASAYEAIEAAHTELREQLHEAAGVSS